MIPPTRPPGPRKEPEAERKPAQKARLWEVDAARGVAILMMVFYHLLYDLETFGGYDVEATTGFWARFADLTAFAFVSLVGVSLAISWSRAQDSSPARGLFGKYLGRGARIFGYGMLLTLVTWLLGMGVIAFGILHLIGVSIILAYPFLRFGILNLFLGLSVIAGGLYVQALNASSESAWLLPLGVVPEGLFMPDYRPLLPWFGVVLLGLFVGNVVYGSGRRPPAAGRKTPLVARLLAPLGRNSLFIYLVHQPVLVALLAVLGVIEVGFL